VVKRSFSVLGPIIFVSYINEGYQGLLSTASFIFMRMISRFITVLVFRADDLNGVMVGYADCYSEGLGFESRVIHGPFQKV
jgi:hypothetical protein